MSTELLPTQHQGMISNNLFMCNKNIMCIEKNPPSGFIINIKCNCVFIQQMVLFSLSIYRRNSVHCFEQFARICNRVKNNAKKKKKKNNVHLTFEGNFFVLIKVLKYTVKGSNPLSPLICCQVSY